MGQHALSKIKTDDKKSQIVTVQFGPKKKKN